MEIHGARTYGLGYQDGVDGMKHHESSLERVAGKYAEGGGAWYGVVQGFVQSVHHLHEQLLQGGLRVGG